MQSRYTPAIDVHGHYGDYFRDEVSSHVNGFMSADAAMVAQRARQVGIVTTIVSPLAGLLPRGKADTAPANEAAARTIAQTDGLLQWVIVHPLQSQTYQQADEMLQQPQCVGIKIHPEEHMYPIREQGQALFEFAAHHDAIVLAHSGDPHSVPADLVEFANAHRNVTLILAHLGNGGDAGGSTELQVRAIQASRHGNVYVDTSSARSLLPGLVEWAVHEVGADRILFGTDTPLYFAAMQRSRIDHSEITDQEKRLILFENAQRIFPDNLT